MLTGLIIQHANGSRQAALTGDIQIQGTNGIQATGSTAGALYIKNTVDDPDFLAQAVNQLLADGPWYLTNINGTGPTKVGNLYMLSSQCTTIANSDAIVSQPFPADGRTPTQPYGGNGITIIDHCPACNDCTNKFKIIEQLQLVQLFLAGIKDNLLTMPATYTDSTGATQHGASQSLWQQTIGLRLNAGANCTTSVDWDGLVDKRQQMVRTAIKQLYQYKALVQLWNYLVNQYNKNTTLSDAAQDFAGLSIQTKRSFNGCNLTGNVVLNIAIQSVSVQSPDAGYVLNSCVLPQPVYGSTRTMLGITTNTNGVAHATGTTGSIQITFPASDVEAVYSLQASFIPYFSPGSTVVDNSKSKYLQDRQAELYQNQGTNMWSVAISWTWTTAGSTEATTQTQTFIYQTARILSPYQQVDPQEE